MVKRIVYRVAAISLGALLGFLLHALMELWYIPHLIADFDSYGLGLSWSQWFTVHRVLVLVLTGGGAALGVAWGSRWWRMIYVERRWSGLWASLRRAIVLH